MPSLDPAGAAERAVLSSTHLAAMNGSAQSTLTGYPSPNIPSPTSPQTHLGTLASRSYRAEPSPATARSDTDHGNYPRVASKPIRRETPTADTPTATGGIPNDRGALKKYQINAPWDQYALYIVYGDQERCLGWMRSR
ncbi:unnamed protein product [Clonostachys rosea f. rosea IK726]|uniref:Uncharacterized protein n=1 Tax=Clonostachys rosea f. rosea IK726 TaxID=1349383 RepID=A0ACA9UBU7_BIOOC|nr:unnamed protein product [Clonostachys rosea f. rosea IK726]